MAKIIGIDTTILIYLLEEHPRYLSETEKLFQKIREGSYEAVFSIIGMIELLTGVKKKSRYDLADSYRNQLAHFPHFHIFSIDETIVDLASDLRARHAIKTPDAIHLATSIRHGAQLFISNDKALKKVKEIKVKLLTE